ncbi:MAG: hypothetical protein L0287_15800 [Anaerolineae bacterium]|nr:hypothetical protein [Anaerolineae bacterium]MCI0608498.1 hypothetical protein [Anaerolineae bacterium]
MDYQQFVNSIKSGIPVGVTLANPGGGDSTIISYSDKNIVYRRGNSKISVSFEDLFEAYSKFRGKKVYTTDLRDFAPKIFDSKQNGHSCNATFLFSILKLLGKATEIKGEGKAHNPFYVTIIAE